jgi:hypothetical protein
MGICRQTGLQRVTWRGICIYSVGTGAYADRQAYLLPDRESCSEEIQRVCRYSVSKGAYADSADLLAGRESCSEETERDLHIL